MASATDLCKRALVSLLKKPGLAYGVALEVTRDSTEAQVRTAFRKVSCKVHPDHGGKEEDQKRLNLAHEAWQNALKQACGTPPGRPARSSTNTQV